MKWIFMFTLKILEVNKEEEEKRGKKQTNYKNNNCRWYQEKKKKISEQWGGIKEKKVPQTYEYHNKFESSLGTFGRTHKQTPQKKNHSLQCQKINRNLLKKNPDIDHFAEQISK